MQVVSSQIVWVFANLGEPWESAIYRSGESEHDSGAHTIDTDSPLGCYAHSVRTNDQVTEGYRQQVLLETLVSGREGTRGRGGQVNFYSKGSREQGLDIHLGHSGEREQEK